MYPAQETARIFFSVVAKFYQICSHRLTDSDLCLVISMYYRISKVHSSALQVVAFSIYQRSEISFLTFHLYVNSKLLSEFTCSHRKVKILNLVNIGIIDAQL